MGLPYEHRQTRGLDRQTAKQPDLVFPQTSAGFKASSLQCLSGLGHTCHPVGQGDEDEAFVQAWVLVKVWRAHLRRAKAEESLTPGLLLEALV